MRISRDEIADVKVQAAHIALAHGETHLATEMLKNAREIRQIDSIESGFEQRYLDRMMVREANSMAARKHIKADLRADQNRAEGLRLVKGETA